MDRRVGRRRGRQVPCEHAISAAIGASTVRRTRKGSRVEACCRHPCRSRDRQLVVTCRASCRTRRARLRPRLHGLHRQRESSTGAWRGTEKQERGREGMCSSGTAHLGCGGFHTTRARLRGGTPLGALDIYIAPPPLAAWGAVSYSWCGTRWPYGPMDCALVIERLGHARPC